MNLERTFGPEAQARIATAVEQAEASSRGQIVPVVVEKSDSYPEARYRGALLAGALVSAIVIGAGVPLTAAELPLVQLGAGALGALLSMWDPIERLLVGRRAMDEAARARALRAFHEEGLHRTAEKTGVLVFASLFEREAVVLGDEAIDEQMGTDWSRALVPLVNGMRRGDPASGFVAAISYCGERLAEHFPPSPGGPPRNELHDTIRTPPH